MTPDELRQYAATTTFRVLGRAILHLFAERDQLLRKCRVLMNREVENLTAEKDREIQRTHNNALVRENDRLRRLVNEKNPAPWEGGS